MRVRRWSTPGSSPETAASLEKMGEQEHEPSPVERRIERSFEDTVGIGKPLSRRTRQTKRSVESYLKGGVLPRYMERLREIEQETANERARIERARRAL